MEKITKKQFEGAKMVLQGIASLADTDVDTKELDTFGIAERETLVIEIIRKNSNELLKIANNILESINEISFLKEVFNSASDSKGDKDVC